jgi:pyruvate kinase
MPYLSDVDKDDILFGIRMEYDFVALSFVRCADDVIAVRKLIEANNGKMRIISKIENMQGIDNLDDILEVSDGIMVARGDMGVEIPMEEVPILQKKMIKKALAAGKIVITATQMLDSMMKNPRPTRAETTDVANAIYDGTSAIMLSGESAAGAYPIESVKTMSRIALRTEQDIGYDARLRKRNHNWENNEEINTAISHACCTTAMDLNAKAIITVTMSGATAAIISKYQPGRIIIGCTVDETVYRQMSLLFGVVPLLIAKEDDAEKLFDEAIKASLAAGLIEKGDRVVLTAGVPLGVPGRTNTIRAVEV